MSAMQAPRNPAAGWRHIDLTLLLATIGVGAIGLLMVFSSTRQKQIAAGLDPAYFLKRQALFLGLGIVVLAVVTLVDYRHIRDFTPVLYAGAVLILLLVLSPLGASRRGTQAWFQLGPYQLEPSELSKLVLILTLAACCAGYRGDLDTRGLLLALGLAAVPMGLIFLQPDLGTDMVFVAILMGVLLVAGARPRHIAALTLMGITVIVLVAQLGILKQYQSDRLSAFLDPQADRHRRRGSRGTGPVPGHPDQPVVRPRAAHRLHLHRRGRGAGLRRRGLTPRLLRRDRVADVAGGGAGP